MAKERDGSINIYGSLQAKTEDGYVAYTDGIAHENEDGTTTTLDQLLADGLGGIIDVDSLPQSGWSGTAVPNSGTVSEVYFNTALSDSEVEEILSSLTYDPDEMYVNTLLFPVGGEGSVICAMVVDGACALFEAISMAVYWANQKGVDDLLPQIGVEGIVAGWQIFDNPIVINSEVINSINTDGSGPVGVENDKISSLFSTTPFVYEEGNINDKAIYRLKEENKDIVLGYKGTTVPNSGTVSEVYFNTALSDSEVEALLSQLTYQADFDYSYGLICISGSSPIIASSGDGLMFIMNVATQQVYWANQLFVNTMGSNFGVTTAGWQTFDNPIAINSEVVTEFEGFAIGTENDKISSLFSTTSFEIEYEIKYTYWVYKDGWSEFGSGDNGVEVNLIDLGEITFNEEHSTDDFKVLFIPFETSIINDSNFENTIVIFSNIIDTYGNKEQVFLKPSKIFYYTGQLPFYTFSGFGKSYAILDDDYSSTLQGDRREYNFVYSELQSKSGTLSCNIGFLGSEITFDSTPTLNSTNAVTSGGVYTALQTKQNKITVTENDDGTVDITIPTT